MMTCVQGIIKVVRVFLRGWFAFPAAATQNTMKEQRAI
jgi:hypothetical protein